MEVLSRRLSPCHDLHIRVLHEKGETTSVVATLRYSGDCYNMGYDAVKAACDAFL